jgi:SulP family sulfate permease
MPALAALLIVAGFQGLRVEAALTAWRTGRVPAAAMLLTFLGTLFLPLHFAVLLGVAFTFVLHASRESRRTDLSELVLVPGGLPEVRPVPAEAPSNQVTVLVVNGTLFFATAKSVGDMLPAVGKSSRAVVVLALRGRTDLGSTFISVLQRYAQAIQAHGGRLLLAGVEQRARDQLARTGLLGIIGEENVFPPTEQLGAAVNSAVAAGHAWLAKAKAGQAP